MFIVVVVFQTICFRQNLIQKIEGLSRVGATLYELDLYDNLLTKIENLEDLVNLTWVCPEYFNLFMPILAATGRYKDINSDSDFLSL